MTKHFLFYLLTISLFFSFDFLSVEANETKANETNPEVIQNLNTQIDQLQNDMQTIKNKESIETYELLLQREKDISSSLYDFTMFFVVIITFFVTVLGVVISILLNKLNKHQKKINLVLNSKEFDEKLNQIEIRLDEFRLKERESKKEKVISKAHSYIEISDRHISAIDRAKTDAYVPNAQQIMEQYNYEDLKSDAEKIIVEIQRLKNVTLSSEDELSGTVLPEDELSQYVEQLSLILDKLQILNWHKLYPV